MWNKFQLQQKGMIKKFWKQMNTNIVEEGVNDCEKCWSLFSSVWLLFAPPQRSHIVIQYNSWREIQVCVF